MSTDAALAALPVAFAQLLLQYLAVPPFGNSPVMISIERGTCNGQARAAKLNQLFDTCPGVIFQRNAGVNRFAHCASGTGSPPLLSPPGARTTGFDFG